MVTYKDLKDLADCGYENNNDLPKGWVQYGKTYKDFPSGFCGKIFIKNNEIVISYSGTDFPRLNDINNDIQMALEKYPSSQFKHAMELYKFVKNNSNLKKYNLTITGHSLGGSLANLVGVQTGEKVVGFCTFGIGNLVNNNLDNYKNVTNIGATDDFIFMSNINKQVGNIKIFPENGEILMPNKFVKSYHTILNLGSELYDAEDYNRYSLKSTYDYKYEILNNMYESIKEVKAEIYNTKNKINNSIRTTRKQFIDNFNQKKNYVIDSIKQNGHWVTIDGRHVFIED